MVKINICGLPTCLIRFCLRFEVFSFNFDHEKCSKNIWNFNSFQQNDSKKKLAKSNATYSLIKWLFAVAYIATPYYHTVIPDHWYKKIHKNQISISKRVIQFRGPITFSITIPILTSLHEKIVIVNISELYRGYGYGYGF